MSTATVTVWHAHRTFVAVAAALLLFLAACAKGEAAGSQHEEAALPAGAATSGPDPCTLLSGEEIQAVMSWAVAKREPSSVSGYSHCTWSSEKGGGAYPPETVAAGTTPCFTNFPCKADTPARFSTSVELAEYRRRLYQGTSAEAADPRVEPVEGLGVPAIMHELGGEYSLEMFLGNRRTAYVTVWTSAEAAHALGEKVLARVR